MTPRHLNRAAQSIKGICMGVATRRALYIVERYYCAKEFGFAEPAEDKERSSVCP